MKKQMSLTAVFFFIAALSCVKEPAKVFDEGEGSRPVETESAAAICDEVIVRFTESFSTVIEKDLTGGHIVTRSSELNGLVSELGIVSMSRLFPEAGVFEARTREAGLHKYYRVRFDASIPRTRAVSGFESMTEVEVVEPVRKIKRTSLFNDPGFSRQWHYYNDGSQASFRAGADINVMPVWENYTTGRSDVIVGVVDQGVDASHEDLSGNYAGGFNFARNNTKVTADDHGTHVAGTIAAVNNNGKGVAGIAGGDAAAKIPGVKILSCQIMDDDAPQQGSGAEAIKWSADHGAVISQNSWGFEFERYEDAKASKIPSYLKDAIDYFIRHAGVNADGVQTGPMKGGVVIFAAGNDGWDANPIAEYDPVIAVGSIAPDFSRAYYSNYGPWVDIAAPGGDYNYSNGQVYSTLPNNKYGYMQGTSMACPHVSGVAALLVSYFGGPGFTADMLVEKLLGGANPNVLSKNAAIGPLLDAYGAFTFGGNVPPERVTDAEVSSASNTVSLTFNVTRDQDDVKAYGYLLLASKNREALNNPDFKQLPADVHSAVTLVNDLKVGARITATVTDLDFDAKYYTAVAGFDYNLNYSQLSPIYEVTTQSNNPPVIESDHSGLLAVHAHETIQVLYDISEPDGHQFDVSFSGGSASASAGYRPDGKYVVSIVGSIADPGKYRAVITATDSYGLSSTETLDYEILANSAPQVVKGIPDMVLTSTGERFTIALDQYISDPDGEVPSYSIDISDRSVLHLNLSENTLYATTLNFGSAVVTIVATDAKNMSCTLKFKVLVTSPESLFSVYPNPVTDWLNIRTGKEGETSVTIRTSAGGTVYQETYQADAVEPKRIDMRKNAPGRYVVTVAFDGETHTKNIVKL